MSAAPKNVCLLCSGCFALFSFNTAWLNWVSTKSLRRTVKRVRLQMERKIFPAEAKRLDCEKPQRLNEITYEKSAEADCNDALMRNAPHSRHSLALSLYARHNICTQKIHETRSRRKNLFSSFFWLKFETSFHRESFCSTEKFYFTKKKHIKTFNTDRTT